ncbi:MAG: antibiotic biosynthesis monooxygenase [Clostridia bacterium]|nr:antibiotic biosynthesis monooxygenase [Clostridia bacterium]
MAITVNIYYSGKNGNAVKFAKEMIDLGIVNKIRNASGNLRYEYFLPMEDSEVVLLIDSWQNQRALDIHHGSPLMTQIVELREKYDLHMKVERYVADESGVSDLDKSFIRE